MNIRILKSFFIITIGFVLGIEALFLWGVPALVGTVVSHIDISQFIEQKTGLVLKTNDCRIKTYPNFLIRFQIDELSLMSSGRSIAEIKALDSKLFLPSLLIKKVNLTNFDAEHVFVNFTRKLDKKFYLGDYQINIPKYLTDYDLRINSFQAQNSIISLNDDYIKQKTSLINDGLIFKFKKKDCLSFISKSRIEVNNRSVSRLSANFDINLKDYSFNTPNSYLLFQDINLADFNSYLPFLLNSDIIDAKGIINVDISSTSENKFNIKTKVTNLELKTDNPLDMIKSENPIMGNFNMYLQDKDLLVEKSYMQSKDWAFELFGKVKNVFSSNYNADLTLKIKDSSINSLYWLIPSSKNDPFNAVQQLKYYGFWGNINADLIIKGNIYNPEIYGDMVLDDVYIVKHNPKVPHFTLNAKFIKDKIELYTKVFTSIQEYVEVKGISELKPYAKGEFEITSTPQVDLETVQYMLTPIHKMFGFDIGPVEYMKLKGKGNINLKTKGTVLDGNAYGQLNFKNIVAELQGLDVVLYDTSGSLDFNGRDMHFYTKNATINGQKLSIDGKANLNGNIDFKISLPTIDIKDLLYILNNSRLLSTKKHIVKPLKSVKGTTSSTITVKGNSKDFGEILKNNTLDIAGKIDLKNCEAITQFSPLPGKNLVGRIEFNDTNWSADLSGKINSSPIKLVGNSTKKETVLKINANSINTDEIVKLLFGVSKHKFIPTINSLMSVNALYKGNGQDIDISKLRAKGFFKPLDGNSNSALTIYSGEFDLNRGTLFLKNFQSKYGNTNISATGSISNIFNKNYNINGNLNVSNLDLGLLNKLKKTNLLPKDIQNFIDTYENYEGKLNIHVNCIDNVVKGKLEPDNVKFKHSYYNTQLHIESGSVLLDGNELVADSIVAKLDDTPVFLNISLFDLDKNAKVKGYLTTKINENFVNKYVNNQLTFPIKVKGDITLTTDILGDLNNLELLPKIKLARNADIYYKGSNLGDEQDEREIVGDIIARSDNNYLIKKLNYVRYMTSQNAKSYPITILSANGAIKASKNDFVFKNFNILTLNKANAKLFNLIFHKSVIKNGLFTCDLKLKGHINEPQILGSISAENLDFPTYNSFIKDFKIDATDKIVHITTNGMALDSDFSINAIMQNSFRLPVKIESVDIKSNKLNFDLLMNYLTQIPTPNTATKLVDSSHSATKKMFDISDVSIKNGQINTQEILIKDLNAYNFDAKFKLNEKNILLIPTLSLDITTGNLSGDGAYEFNTGKIKTNISAFNVDSNKIATTFFEFKDQIYGAANGNVVMSTYGKTEDERLNNLVGHAYFEIADGKMPKLGSVEYLLRASSFFKGGISGLSLNNILEIINPIKTGDFESIKGSVDIKNGVAQNIELYSKSDNLNLFINGEYDMTQEYANMRVYGRLTQKATRLLGKIGNVSLNTIISQLPGMKLTNIEKDSYAKELNKIPGVELNDELYKTFTVKIDGNINDEKYVKNFRWID